MPTKRKNIRCIVNLRRRDRDRLNDLLAGGVESVRVLKRAMILLKMDGGISANAAAAALGGSPEAARKIGWRYINGGLEDALYDRPRPGQAPLLTASQKKKLIAIACSSPPKGAARWSTATLAAELVKRKITDHISKETVRLYLHSADLKPWREKNVVHPGPT